MFERKRLLKFIKILCILVIVELIGIVVIKNVNYEIPQSNDKPKDEEKIEKTPTTFLGTINNKTNVSIPKEITKLITDYMNTYYKSIYELKAYDTSIYFSNQEEGYISKSAIELLVDIRKLYNYDYKLSKAQFDLNILDVKQENNKYIISFNEDDTFYFKFLDGIESNAYGINNEIVISFVNNEYKIDKYRKVEDYYVMFTNIYSFNNNTNELDNMKKAYLEEAKEEISNYDNLYKETKDNQYVSSITCTYKYDRKKAVEYSYKYINTRNNEWVDYSSYGGNCQNYASQAIYYGGVPMDNTGHISLQWKHYSSIINSYETKSGRSSSWTGVGDFYYYVKNNKGTGLCGSTDVNIFYAEPGDIIQVGYKNIYRHTTFVSKIITKNNNMPIILVNSNSINLKDYPISAYTYTMKRLIKIEGYN